MGGVAVAVVGKGGRPVDTGIEHGGVLTGQFRGGGIEATGGVDALGGQWLHEGGVHHGDQVLAVLDDLFQVADLASDHMVQVLQVAVELVGTHRDAAEQFAEVGAGVLGGGYSDAGVQVEQDGGETAETESVAGQEQSTGADDLLLLLPGLGESGLLDALEHHLLLLGQQSEEQGLHHPFLSLPSLSREPTRLSQSTL